MTSAGRYLVGYEQRKTRTGPPTQHQLENYSALRLGDALARARDFVIEHRPYIRVGLVFDSEASEPVLLAKLVENGVGEVEIEWVTVHA